MSNIIAELRDVRKNFQDSLIFSGIDLWIEEGETIGICGDSGSGKTTLMNVLGMLDRPSGGSVIWEGNDVTGERSSKLSKLRPKLFGYIFQRCNLIPELNVLENLLFPRRIVTGVEQSDVDFAKNLLKRVSMSGAESRNITTLSGGERQRVAVVRAMMNHPKIIIADEPTGSLDERSADAVMDMIVGLCGEYGSALLLITHNGRFAKKMNTSHKLHGGKLEKIHRWSRES
ncbi:MAG: ABC transporter ATP-binding protein [Puniceicoccales bacterium]|jgi:ABC-type lipoprotein export system ATPase subunit|nr:ABC transporter ATP-binding protein [Puniceicoccales bacterium]